MTMITIMRTRTTTRTTTMDDFIWRALIGGIGLAAVAGPFGSFVVWRRMAFFGDALAHSALLGVMLGYLLQIDFTLGAAAVGIVFAAALAALQGKLRIADDTLLGVISQSMLALGLVSLSFLDRLRVDLLALLFGDILSITTTDLAWIYFGGAAVLAVLAWLWRPLLSLTVHEELAQVEGVAISRVRPAFAFLLAIVVAAAMKIVGVLLITALLIVPAATARRFARTPEQMAVLAAALGAVSIVGGLAASMAFDTPAGPSAVTVAALLFSLSAAFAIRAR
jgi:zinc transport system permease protein